MNLEVSFNVNDTLVLCIFLVCLSSSISLGMSKSWQKQRLNNFELVCGVVAVICSLIIVFE
jgi:hypothetical protein